MARPTPLLFQPIAFRGVTARNRIAVSPMCQYSAVDGVGNDWHNPESRRQGLWRRGHRVHRGPTHVSAAGRITAGCLGLWNDAQEALLARLAAIITQAGAVPGIQIAHAGRKGSSEVPWEGGKPVTLAQGGWQTVAPSAVPYSPRRPRCRTRCRPPRSPRSWPPSARTARRARRAGFKIAEVHGAHGYLLHQFLSPLSKPPRGRLWRRPRRPGADADGGDRRRCAPNGRTSCRCSCGCPARTGPRAASRSRTRWRWRGCSRRAATWT